MEKAENTQIPVETQAARIFDLIWDIWQYQGPDVYQFIREKIRPMPMNYLWALFRVVLISFIPSIILIWLGFSMNSRWLIFLGGIWRAGCTVLLLVALTPVGLLIEVARKGKEGSGQRWAETISGTFIGELFFTLIVLVLLPQMKARIDLMPVLIMASMILGMAGGAAFGKGFIAPAAGVIFVATLAFYVFPGPINKVLGGIIPGNALEHFEIDLKELEEGRVVFFDPNGSPLAWYYLDVANNRVRSIELFTREGYHPIANVKLRPIDRRNVNFIIETKGRYLHPANIKKPGSQSETRSSMTTKPAVREPPPEKLPAVSPPEIPSQINLSKPWKYRYEVIPGYQKYKERAFSGWASARIERWDSEIKVVTLAPDGREIGDFSGTRTGPGAYQGSWSMRDGSGRGKFYCNRENSDRITGSMNDETVGPLFLPMELSTGQDAQAEIPTRYRQKVARPKYDASRNARKKRELARVPYPAPSEPRRVVEPRLAPAFSPEPEVGYKKATMERKPVEQTVQFAPLSKLPKTRSQVDSNKRMEAKNQTEPKKEARAKESSGLAIIDEWAPDFEELKRELNRKD